MMKTVDDDDNDRGSFSFSHHCMRARSVRWVFLFWYMHGRTRATVREDSEWVCCLLSCFSMFMLFGNVEGVITFLMLCLGWER
ncbi:hypothetical protein DM02DRAFT_168670 [Periconia macrospinosa]|uniref:Transmembrane protein n=1 Tax=Periconia macrospinosa TaxID=97972 RepID=A0A2V1DAB2_9PLEO|nr:hypothetical protein DM02DRAFT_168670 [Periconia macrospinosa]